MLRTSMLPHLLCLIFALCLPLESWAQDEEPVFSGDEATATGTSPVGIARPEHPATAYWKISATVDLQAAPPGTHVQMLLPLSDARQSILERRTGGEGINYREEADGLNLWGHWLVTQASETSRQLVYEYTVQIADAATTVPTIEFPPKDIPLTLQQYLVPSAQIQSNAEAVRTQAAALTRTSTRTDQAVRSIHQYV